MALVKWIKVETLGFETRRSLWRLDPKFTEQALSAGLDRENKRSHFEPEPLIILSAPPLHRQHQSAFEIHSFHRRDSVLPTSQSETSENVLPLVNTFATHAVV